MSVTARRRSAGTLVDRRRLVFALITAAAVAAVGGAVATYVVLPLEGRFSGPFEDFGAYAQAAHLVAQGVTPYAGFDPRTIVMSGFDYPPFAAVMLRPLAFLGLRWQEVAWLWIALTALVGGAVLTARTVLPASWPRVRLALAVSLTFPPATYNLWHGQMNTVIFLLLALALRDYVGGRRTRCGTILGIAAGIKLAPVVLLLVLARRGWWRGVAAGAGALAATVLVGVVALGWSVSHQYLTTVLPVLNRDNGWIYNQAWNGVVNRLAGHSVLGVGAPTPWLHLVATLLSLATVGVLWVTVRRGARTRTERSAEFACGVVTMLLVGSVIWYPVYVHLLIAIAAAAALAWERRDARPAGRAAAAAFVGIGVVACVAISAMSITGIEALSHGPTWWLFLQACSLPAVLAAILLAALARPLRVGPPVRGAVLAR